MSIKMPPKKISPRQEYRQQEKLRVEGSASLSEKFQALKSLTVDLAHFGPEGLSRITEIKYSVNLAYAKSLFRVHCPNPECVGGDFDLSDELAKAVAAHQTTASGEVVCRGWRDKTSIDRAHCLNMLRYRLTLRY